MGFHTFDPAGADRLDDPTRFRFCSREELLAALDPDPTALVADLGSGTGFYTDEVAPFVERLYAVDVQDEMHERYRENGVPESVDLVTANVESLPFEDDELDAAFSTMTFHEFASDAALAECRHVLAPGARLVTVDWSAAGSGEDGPPVDERYAVETVISMFEKTGFAVERAEERPETLLVVATA
jgi:ubiquinone/menaquinone biosynthesis C-methylase UbiE